MRPANLPIQNGSIRVNMHGVVTIGAPAACTVYPFSQPQAYYAWTMPDGDQMFTTNGCALLAQSVNRPGEMPQVRVRASFALMAALLIAPDGLTLADLEGMGFDRDTDVFTFYADIERFGCIGANSKIVFANVTNGIDVEIVDEHTDSWRDDDRDGRRW